MASLLGGPQHGTPHRAAPGQRPGRLRLPAAGAGLPGTAGRTGRFARRVLSQPRTAAVRVFTDREAVAGAASAAFSGLLDVSGLSRRLRPPIRRPWTELVARTGEALLLLGLAPLPQSADAAQVDAYLDAALTADWLLFGRA